MIFERARKVYGEFPRPFWTLVGVTFIDRLGGALIYPFLALYVTYRFQVGMTQVGEMFAIFAVSGLFGNVLSGAITDKFGRRKMIIFGLVVSALSSLSLGLADRMELFFVLVGVVGLLANSGGPARQAMVADLLPRQKRAEGFGILRVALNLSVTFGPMIGGLLASWSYLSLFVIDAVISVITAGIVFAALPETKPQASPEQAGQSLLQTVGGYRHVLRDSVYMAFVTIALLSAAVYMQMNTTLSVFLRDVHGVSPQGYGYILSLNAAMVVLFQFWVTRRIRHWPALVTMAVGTAFYAAGFAMYGFVSLYALFLLAMVVITVGEMIVAPVTQALVARFAPEDMRGRYMAMFGFSWIVSSAVGPWAAGLIMDNFNPNWVWYSAGIVAAIAALGYAGLHLRVGDQLEEEKDSPEMPAVVAVEPSATD